MADCMDMVRDYHRPLTTAWNFDDLKPGDKVVAFVGYGRRQRIETVIGVHAQTFKTDGGGTGMARTYAKRTGKEHGHARDWHATRVEVIRHHDAFMFENARRAFALQVERRSAEVVARAEAAIAAAKQRGFTDRDVALLARLAADLEAEG